MSDRVNMYVRRMATFLARPTVVDSHSMRILVTCSCNTYRVVP